MGEIYEHSYFTITATVAADSEAGCSVFSPPAKGCKLGGPFDPMYVRQKLDHKLLEGSSSSATLLTRARVYQKRLLSPRVIHFHSSELTWECCETTACERGWFQNAGGGRFEPKQEFKRVQKYKEHESLSIPFRKAVTEYSRLDLTFMKDKLPAFAGIAKQFVRPASGRYLAGLWESTLIEGLDWYVSSPPSDPDSPNKEPSSVRNSTAPSWSWASVQKAVYPDYHDDPPDDPPEERCKVINFECIPLGPDRFGECASGLCCSSRPLGSSTDPTAASPGIRGNVGCRSSQRCEVRFGRLYPPIPL
jgi:hypothetical protein